MTAEAVRGEFTAFLASRPGLVSVTRSAGSYKAVLGWPDAPAQTLSLSISPLGITSYAAGCAPVAAARAQ